MRYCVNPECPYQVKYRRPAEYMDTAAVCSDCGRELGAAAAVAQVAAPPDAAAMPWSPEVWRRVLVSAGVLAAVVAGYLVSMPGVVAVRSRYQLRPEMSLLGVGSSPFLWAMLLVDVAAMAVPSLRRLREDGVRGQRRLRQVALVIGLAFAAMQSWAPIDYYESKGLLEAGSVTAAAGWSPAALMLVLFCGSVFTVLAAWVADTAGVGSGFAVVVAGEALAEVWLWTRVWDVDSPVMAIVVLAVSGGAMVWLFRRGERPAPGGEEGQRPRALPYPVAGVLPILVSRWIVFSFLSSLMNAMGWLSDLWVSMLKSPPAMAVLQAVIGVNAAIAAGLLFYRPSSIAAAWVRWAGGPGEPGELARARVGARVRALLPAAIGWGAVVVAIWVLPQVLSQAVYALGFDVVKLIALIAIALDFREEAAARSGSKLVTAWVLTRPYEVEPALEALQAAGVRASARGRHARATFLILGQLLPIEVLVPPDQVEKARAVLGAAG